MKQYLLKVWMTAALSLLALGGVWGQVDYVPNFPVVSEIGESQISLEVQVDQEVSGLRSYYVLLESGETPPSLIEVFKGYPSGTYEDYPIIGNLSVSNTTNKQTAVISGLNPGTNYSLYVFTRHVEDESIVIEEVNPTRIDFSTVSSPSPVQYVPNFPVVSEIGESQITLEVQVDQAVFGLRSYYVLLENGEISPSLLEVFKGYSPATLEDYPIKGNLNVYTTIKQTAVISGLNPGTNYSLYVFTRHVEDESIVIEEVNPTRIDFSTVSSPSPVQYVSNFPVVSEIGESQVTLEVQVDQSVVGLRSYYVLLESGETPPSLIEVFNGYPSETIVDYPIKGNLNVYTTIKQTAVISGLNPGTNYSLYVFTRHVDGSIVIEQASPTKIDFETLSEDGLIEWTGGGDAGNWSDARNWSGVYAAGKSVIIPVNSSANYPVISADVEVNNLTIDAGAVLTHNGGVLTVLGEFILKSSVDVNASYINSGAEGVDIVVNGDKVRVEQVINNIDLSYVISSPTNGSTQDNFGGYYPLYYYENSSDSWQSISPSSAMTSGVGYRMWTDDTMVNFSGDFNIGSVLVSLRRTKGQGYGWNFVGNPYPAAIDWNRLNVTGESTVEDNFWMWMPTQKSYGSYSASTGIAVNIESSKIPSNHGFLVKVKQGLTSGSLEFLPSAQVANDAMYLKSASSKPLTSHFKLAGISAEGFRDEFAVAFVDGAVEGVDRYDMEKRFANQRHLFELFSLSGSLKSVINSVPNVGFIEIPLGYNALQTGTVGVELVNSNLEDAVVILVDELTDEETVLEEGGRVDVFISQKGMVNDRFKLRVSRVVTSDSSIVVTEEQNSRIRVVVKDRNIHLFLSEPGSYEGFMICDVQGRVIRSGALSGAQFESLGSFSDGVYLIQLFNSEIGSVENVKVVVY